MFSGNGMNLKAKYNTDRLTGIRMSRNFFIRDVLLVAPGLIGKTLVTRSANNSYSRFIITETEAYRGVEDKACHACRGKTARTEVMFQQGGKVYVYFVYGMYWMLNFVTGEENNPQAVLIRGTDKYNGPGKLTRALGIDKSFYGEDLTSSDRIWIEDTGFITKVKTGRRIGIDYAGEPWKSKLWRYYTDIYN